MNLLRSQGLISPPKKGKALFFKTIVVEEKEDRSDFRMVPNGLTLAEGRRPINKTGCCGRRLVPRGAHWKVEMFSCVR